MVVLAMPALLHKFQMVLALNRWFFVVESKIIFSDKTPYEWVFTYHILKLAYIFVLLECFIFYQRTFKYGDSRVIWNKIIKHQVVNMKISVNLV